MTPSPTASPRASLFASTALAARIERAERRLIEDAARSAAARHAELGIELLPLGDGIAAWAGADSPLTKVAGVFTGPLAEAELAAVERLFGRHATPVRVELSTLADPSIAPLLARRGYVLQGFENVLGRPLGVGAGAPAPSPPAHGPSGAAPSGTNACRSSTPLPDPPLAIRESSAADFDLWLDVVVTGFAVPDAEGVPSDEEFPREVLERVITDMAGAAGFTRYLARRGDTPVGGASLRLGERVAQLCGAATLPAHRRRGVQSALLAHRLAVAAAAGCDVAVVTTQPGSKSCENVQRQGFDLLYARAVLVRGD